MKKKAFIIPLVFAIVLLVAAPALAHTGTLDSRGGHKKNADSTYHYHYGGDRKIEFPAPPATPPVSVTINDISLDCDQEPVYYYDEIMLPIRVIAEKMGRVVEWDSKSRIVYINSPDVPVIREAAPANDIGVFLDNVKVAIDGQQPIVLNDRVMAPSASVAEIFGLKMDREVIGGKCLLRFVEMGRDNPLIVSVDNIPLTVHFIDVGQGDSILIDYGEYEILIDGSVRQAGKKVTEYIRPFVDGPIDLIVATHPDLDHIGGVIDVIYNYEVSRIIDNGEKKSTGVYNDFRAAALAEKGCVYETAADIVIPLSDKVSFQIIPPVKKYGDTNDNSVVCILTYDEVKILFTGDMGIKSERDLLSRFSKADILKSGHHGSRTSSCAEFLNVVSPEYVIISAGKVNTYGHPHYDALRNYFKVKATVYGTFKDGTIVVQTDGKSYTIDAKTPLTLNDAMDVAA